MSAHSCRHGKNPPLTAVELAQRWGLTERELKRRISRLGLPAINVGTERDPDLVFRLETIERWEAANDKIPGVALPSPEIRPPAVVRPGVYGWDGKRRLTQNKGRLRVTSSRVP
jgi:hypothetical protein